MKQIGILFTARLGSSRLKRKHLLKVNNKPILEFLIRRVQDEFANEIISDKVKLVIATSNEEENYEFEYFLYNNQCNVYYGCKSNIPLRHLEAAKKYEFDAIVSVDGDDILCSVEAMRKVYEKLVLGSNFVKTQGLPFGMNVTGYSTELLEKSLHNHMRDTLETGWGRIFDKDSLEIIDIDLVEDNNRLRFTLDYDDDYQFFKQVIIGMSDRIFSCSTKDIVEYVQKLKLYEITDKVNEEYWVNFNLQVQAEKI